MPPRKTSQWPKSRPKNWMELPPLTTPELGTSTTPDWHKIKNDEPPTNKLWEVCWNTSRGSGEANKARETTEVEAFDRAKRFVQMGFVVFSINDPLGVEVMDESAINARFKPQAT